MIKSPVLPMSFNSLYSCHSLQFHLHTNKALYYYSDKISFSLEEEEEEEVEDSFRTADLTLLL